MYPTRVRLQPTPPRLKVADLANGTYAARYTATRAGPAALAVSVGDLPVPASPFSVRVVPGVL